MKRVSILLSIALVIMLSTSAQAATKYYVNYDFLNVRSGPSTSYKLKGKLYRNEKVAVYKISKGWAQIKYKNKKAYVCASYLSKVSNKNGWICSGGIWDFYRNGSLIPSAWGTHEAYTKIKGTYSGSQYKIVVKRSSKMLYIFKAGPSGWEPFKQWYCCVGKASTPTPKGSFSLNGKMFRMDSIMPGGKSTEFYSTSFYGDYCIHSTLYRYGSASPTSSNHIDGTMGEAVSNGCIRLSTSNAKWLYNNIPTGTAIYIY